jgi:hypothetical protein
VRFEGLEPWPHAAVIVPPVIVIDREGEVGFYASAAEAGLDLESPDVDAHEYRAFDAVGQRLAIESEEPSRQVGELGRFEVVSSSPAHVRAAVPPGLREAPLDEVIEAARGRLG